MIFTAIDFETATGKRYSACAVGIVTVKNGDIIDEYNSLIQPPDNEYSYYNTQVHGISENDTYNALSFPDIYHEIKHRLYGKTIVAHNESFDRSVLQKTMEYYNLDYSELNISNQWECTLKIYRSKGYKPASLDFCCKRQEIKLNHHEALSDARGCAMLYLRSGIYNKMKEQVDPKLYGLPPRTVLMKQDSKKFILIINRKSRIIMNDAITILKKVEKIKEKVQDASVILETSAPVCSKSIKFLKANSVDVLKSI